MERKKFPYFSIRPLIIYLTKRYFPFDIRTFQIKVGVITAILVGSIFILGWLTTNKVKEVVTEDFNSQQLVIAQHTARHLENELYTLKRELLLLGFSPSIQYNEKSSIANRMEITFSSVKDKGVLEIQYLEPTKSKTHIMDKQGYYTVSLYPEDAHNISWLDQIKNQVMIIKTETVPVNHESKDRKVIMKMAIPVWQSSINESHPVATNKFSGVLLFVIDASAFAEKIVKDIRSGKTGYAWVINENGIFLYHPHKEFTGKSAFGARIEKEPTMSFARINEIQKEKMLKGEEGTSWYITGWHRGIVAEMKKLIAYAPIRLNESGKLLWSVAIVAPISEVEEAVHSIHIRQFMLQTTITAVILLGSMTILFLILNWSSAMEQEVDRKTIELKKSEQRYKSLVENAEDIIFVVDQHGNYLSINKYGAHFLNRKPEEIIGHNMSEIIPRPGAEIPLQMIKEVFDTKETRQITHTLRIGEDDYWLNTNLRRLWDEAGNVYAALGISRDITALKEKEKEEQRYNIEKLASMGTLAAGVAHEINNPLGIILGFSDLLIEKSKPGTEQYDILKTIEKQAFNAKKVVENLLTFARYSEDKGELVDINENIEQILSIVKNTLFLNKISLKQELHDNLPKVIADPLELEQVFLNIINNAIHAMRGGGVLTITTNLINEKIEIRFSDTGQGIKKDHRSKIFDPLFTTKKVGEGTGLGLSVSYGIVSKYGGTIAFETKTKEESEKPGTTFIITLPIKAGDKE